MSQYFTGFGELSLGIPAILVGDYADAIKFADWDSAKKFSFYLNEIDNIFKYGSDYQTATIYTISII